MTDDALSGPHSHYHLQLVDLVMFRMALIAVLAAGSVACTDVIKDIFDGGSPTSPSDPGTIRSYLGNWSGPADAKPAAQSCASQQWKITSQSGGQFSGDFSAECGDGVKLAGTLNATHGEATIPFAVTGNATKGDTNCPFSMTGTGTFQGTSNIALDFAGASACLGPFSGTETIRR